MCVERCMGSQPNNGGGRPGGSVNSYQGKQGNGRQGDVTIFKRTRRFGAVSSTSMKGRPESGQSEGSAGEGEN